MILGFKTKFTKALDNAPTLFIEKIRSGAKPHTLREDKCNRWKAGRTIQFYTGGYRQKERLNFWEDNTCKATEAVHITHTANGSVHTLSVTVDMKKLSGAEITELAERDGFKNSFDFMTYFVPNVGDSWTGKIIHWTDKRYGK